jgi:hypothetical protein
VIESNREHPVVPSPPADVDSVCDAFEAAWFAGHQPRIEEFLARADPVHYDELLRELLLSEWDLRRRHGQHVELETYLARFPERGQFITDWWRAWNERPSESLTTDPAYDTGPASESGLLEQPGTAIDRYKLLEKVGEGGFADVWAAEQREPVKRRVALKILKLGMDARQVVARFEAERQALALMDHPNIAKVLDGGSTETGRPYFVMELVRGPHITAYCDQNQPRSANVWNCSSPFATPFSMLTKKESFIGTSSRPTYWSPKATIGRRPR